MAKFNLKVRSADSDNEIKKYHLIRRESFNLLRQKIRDKQAASFIDDFVVVPNKLPEFLPKLNAILNEYKIVYTVAGHVGDGNFHIIPLLNLSLEKDRKIIPELMERVYDLVLQFLFLFVPLKTTQKINTQNSARNRSCYHS